MKLPGLVLVVVLTCSDVIGDHQDPDCEDCNENGSWFPLFQPSQIISSEFPEHEQYRSGEAPPPLTYATARPQVSREHQSHEAIPQVSREHQSHEAIPQVSREHQSHEARPLVSREHQSYEARPQVSREHQSHESQEVPQEVDLGSREVSGVDTPLKSYSGGGSHRVEWDHYGDVTTVATVYNHLERGDSGVSGEDRSDPDVSYQSREDADTSASVRSDEFFDAGSFFNDKSRESFSEDFESNELPFVGENHDHGNSIEFDSPEFGRGGKVATSYASISSVFESRPVPRARDLLHPDFSMNGVPHYINMKPRRMNRTRNYLVRELSLEDVSHPYSREYTPTMSRNRPVGPLGPRPSSFVPADHPVYRYVKEHGGLSHRRPAQSRSTLSREDIHPQLRNKFPFKYLPPRVHVQSQKTFVKHVMPTKDPFSDSFFKESQKIENLKPPPPGQTLYYFKKKPDPVELKHIARRSHSPGYLYIIRRSKKQT